VFIRKGGDGKAQLVLLDHGLYETLRPHERKALCSLYKAIIMLREEDMQKYSLQLGVRGQYSPSFPNLLLLLSFKSALKTHMFSL
jgi:predicted unusual protein kinase regulating ubiquinone biosynthesis (AarF/ABC1/UbiB family)